MPHISQRSAYAAIQRYDGIGEFAEITRVEYRGQQVVTFAMIDKVHGRPKDTARKRFNENKVRFIEGEDYFSITQPSEIRTLGVSRPQGGTPESITLVNKRGYLKIAKTLGDDKASIFDRRHPERKRYDHVMRDINRLPQIWGSPRRSTVVVGEGVLGFKEPRSTHRRTAKSIARALTISGNAILRRLKSMA